MGGIAGLWWGASLAAPVMVCDVNGDGATDNRDIEQLVTQLGTTVAVPGTAGDGDGDGLLTGLDLDFCTLASPPVADAGLDQAAALGDTVVLDASASTDRDGPFLAYHWEIVEAPAGSGATLDDPEAVKPTLTLDRPGTYVIALQTCQTTSAAAACCKDCVCLVLHN
ncbi:MAG: PKD domain-containing protein [Candidatus Competibacterales bacterium]